MALTNQSSIVTTDEYQQVAELLKAQNITHEEVWPAFLAGGRGAPPIERARTSTQRFQLRPILTWSHGNYPVPDKDWWTMPKEEYNDRVTRMVISYERADRPGALREYKLVGLRWKEMHTVNEKSGENGHVVRADFCYLIGVEGEISPYLSATPW